MVFGVIARDFKGEAIVNKRLTLREKHLARIKEYQLSGYILDGGAMLNADNQMIGSMLLVDFETEASVLKFLHSDIYHREGVWETFEIIPLKRLPKDFI